MIQRARVVQEYLGGPHPGGWVGGPAASFQVFFKGVSVFFWSIYTIHTQTVFTHSVHNSSREVFTQQFPGRFQATLTPHVHLIYHLGVLMMFTPERHLPTSGQHGPAPSGTPPPAQPPPPPQTRETQSHSEIGTSTITVPDVGLRPGFLPPRRAGVYLPLNPLR